MTRVIVDADVWAYSCGGATQRTLYDWMVVEGDAIVDSGIAADRDELNAVRSLLPEGARLETTEIVEAEPLEHALALCKRSIIGVEEAMEREGVDFDRLELWLTGKGNFREQIATIKGYKANRVGVPKPVHYKAIRRYMRERWKAEVTRGWEADDALAMVANDHGYDPEAVVLVSQDKDLRTVPGRHYNPRKKAWSIVTEREALVNFYRQVVTGDATDNIGGCYKTGAKGADALFAGIGEEDGEMGLAAHVLVAYEESLGKKGCPYTDAKEAMLENARLLHMARTVKETRPGGYWSFPWERT